MLSSITSVGLYALAFVSSYVVFDVLVLFIMPPSHALEAFLFQVVPVLLAR